MSAVKKKVAYGKIIFACRSKLRLSQAKLASEISVAVRTVNAWENNKQKPSLELLTFFLESGMNARWLLSGEGPMMQEDAQSQTQQASPGNELELYKKIDRLRDRIDELYAELDATRNALADQDLRVLELQATLAELEEVAVRDEQTKAG